MENTILSGMISASAFQSQYASGIVVIPQEGTELSSQAQQATATAQMSREDKFREQDASGAGVAIISMSVVIGALAMLAIIFIILGRFMHKRANSKKSAPVDRPSAAGKVASVASSGSEEEGAVFAAIGLALWEYERSMGDQESGIITIDEELQSHSGWNARIQSVMGNQLSR